MAKKNNWLDSYKDGGIVKMKGGGQATTQDSVDVYNNAVRVNDFYKNSGRYHIDNSQSMYTDNDRTVYNYVNDKNARDIEDYTNKGFTYPQMTPDGAKSLPMSEYRQDIDKNRYKQRELTFGVLNTNAPMQLFDKRITPQKHDTWVENYPFFSSGKGIRGVINNGEADIAEVFQYDPIAVKPWGMLTPEEKQVRIQKYGEPKKALPKSKPISKIESRGLQQIQGQPQKMSSLELPVDQSNYEWHSPEVVNGQLIHPDGFYPGYKANMDPKRDNEFGKGGKISWLDNYK